MARDGYSGATIERIAEEAGYSKGAFYSNFENKEDIFLQLLERNAGGDVVEFTGLLDGYDDPKQSSIRCAIGQTSGRRTSDGERLPSTCYGSPAGTTHLKSGISAFSRSVGGLGKLLSSKALSLP